MKVTKKTDGGNTPMNFGVDPFSFYIVNITKLILALSIYFTSFSVKYIESSWINLVIIKYHSGNQIINKTNLDVSITLFNTKLNLKDEEFNYSQ